MEVAAAPPARAAGAAPSTITTSWLVPLLVLIVGMFMSVLDISIVNVAIPTIQKDFGASTQDVQWISTAYSLALGVVVPITGWLGDRFGLTRVYLSSVALFAVASGLCGLAWDLPSLIAFRILQAVPGGVIPVVSMSMVYLIVPPRKMGTAMGIYGLGIVFGPAIGPTLGGYLVEYMTWPLIFFINVPVGLIGAAAGLALIPTIGATARRPLDWWGFGTISTGLFLLLLACSKGQDWGWTSYRVLVPVTVAVLLLALFVVIELERDQPLIDLRVFSSWVYTNSLLLITVLTVGLFAVLFYLPLFLQETQGVQPLRTGLLLLPEALVMGVMMPVAGKLYDVVGPKWPGVVGLSVAAVGGILLCGINVQMTQSEVVVWTCIRAFGNALAMMPIFTAGMAAIPPRYMSSGAAMNNIVQRVSSSLGLAVMTVVTQRNAGQLMADRTALIPRDTPIPGAPAGVLPGGPHGTPAAGPGVVEHQGAMLGYYRHLQGQVIAGAYSTTFLIAAVLTVVGIGLAFFMRATDRSVPDPATPVTPVPAPVFEDPAGRFETRPAAPGSRSADPSGMRQAGAHV